MNFYLERNQNLKILKTGFTKFSKKHYIKKSNKIDEPEETEGKY